MRAHVAHSLLILAALPAGAIALAAFAVRRLFRPGKRITDL